MATTSGEGPEETGTPCTTARRTWGRGREREGEGLRPEEEEGTYTNHFCVQQVPQYSQS